MKTPASVMACPGSTQESPVLPPVSVLSPWLSTPFCLAQASVGLVSRTWAEVLISHELNEPTHSSAKFLSPHGDQCAVTASDLSDLGIQLKQEFYLGQSCIKTQEKSASWLTETGSGTLSTVSSFYPSVETCPQFIKHNLLLNSPYVQPLDFSQRNKAS